MKAITYSRYGLDAVAGAGVARFRPIFLTAITTYFGLVPLMFEANPQATMLIPMAISLGYGVLFSSFFTLYLVPSLYVVLEDIKSLLSRRRSPALSEPESPPPIDAHTS